MKIYNNKKYFNLSHNLKNTLNLLRKQNKFDPKEYIEVKAYLLNKYLKKHGLSSCIVAISGGIDSATVLAIVKYAQNIKGSPIKRIIPVCLPALDSQGGVVNQSEATQRGLELIKKFNLTPYSVDLSKGFLALKQAVDKSLNINGKEWANGQYVPYLRTASLYYITALENQNGNRGVIVGTTNKDEGAYLGYFGKASDGMVDLQLISDIHKSEVKSVAKFLNVTKAILNIIPTGDMFDSRSDEDVFGTSYDFVELFLRFKKLDKSIIPLLASSWNNSDRKQYNYCEKKIEKMHQYNLHKYIGCSPAVHLDLWDSSFIGGWKTHLSYQSNNGKDYSKFNGFFKIKKKTLSKLSLSAKLINDNKGVQHIALLNKEVVRELVEEINQQAFAKAGFTGYKENDKIVGSYRATFESKIFAENIYFKLQKLLPKFINNEDGIFHFSGISDIFRVIKYDDKGGLYPHYDHSFKFNKNEMTLKSLVIYLTPCNNKTNGRTRFIKNNKKNSQDWLRKAKNEEIDFLVNCEIGESLVFDHDKFHDSEDIKNSKIIIRTDLIYKRLDI